MSQMAQKNGPTAAMAPKRGKAPAAAEYKVKVFIDHRFHRNDALDDDFKHAQYRALERQDEDLGALPQR